MVQIKEPITPPKAMRLSFQKRGVLQYVSHLDLQRTFTRAILRAGIPVWYTEGFNPKPRIAFSPPLSVGCESVCEMMDFRIVRDASPEEMKAALNANLPPELAVFEVYEPTRKMAEIAYATYLIRIENEGDESKAEAVRALLADRPMTVLKRTKNGEKETDISPLVQKADVFCAEGDLCIRATLAAGGGNFLNPEYLVTYLSTGGLILQGALPTRLYSILREELLDADLAHFC